MKKHLIIFSVILASVLAYGQLVLPAQVESSMNTKIDHDAGAISERAQALHETLFVADLHTDSLLWKRDLAERSEVGHVDVPRMHDGNVALQVFSATTKSPKGHNVNSNTGDTDNITALAVASMWPPATWNSIYERAAYQLEKLHDLAARSDVTVVTNKTEMRELIDRRARGERVIGGIYLIEGAHPLEGDIGNLDRLYESGLRIMGITHFFDNELGGSLHGVSKSGLTEFGREAVRRANELGIIIDIAHASPAVVTEVLEISAAPVILSHGGIRSHCDTPRNLDDDIMKAMAAKGGILGVGFWKTAVCDPTPAGVVRAIRHAIDVLGVEHVALGSDYDGTIAVTFDIGELVLLTDAMLDAGFTEAEIRAVMGDNVRRFMLENLPD